MYQKKEVIVLVNHNLDPQQRQARTQDHGRHECRHDVFCRATEVFVFTKVTNVLTFLSIVRYLPFGALRHAKLARRQVLVVAIETARRVAVAVAVKRRAGLNEVLRVVNFFLGLDGGTIRAARSQLFPRRAIDVNGIVSQFHRTDLTGTGLFGNAAIFHVGFGHKGLTAAVAAAAVIKAHVGVAVALGPKGNVRGHGIGSALIVERLTLNLVSVLADQIRALHSAPSGSSHVLQVARRSCDDLLTILDRGCRLETAKVKLDFLCCRQLEEEEEERYG